MGIIGDVKDGWGNYLKALKWRDEVIDPEIEALATERAEICGECPELKESGLFSFVESVITNVAGDKTHRRTKVSVDPVTAKKDSKDIYRGFKCGHCGCGFPAIVYAPKKSCPLGKW